MSQTKIKRKSKGIPVNINYEELSKFLQPQLIKAVQASLPQKETYEKAIAELNSANVSLQQKNKELIEQLDKYNREIDQTFQDHENRLQVLEGKNEKPENTENPDVPAETP